MTNSLRQKLYNYGGVAAAFLLAIVALIYKILEPEPKWHFDAIGVLAILFTLIFDRIGTVLERNKEEQERKQAHCEVLKALKNSGDANLISVEALYERLRNSTNLERVGKANTTPKLLMERIREAKTIRNTFVQLGNFSKRTLDDQRSLLEVYESVLSRPDTTWFDIVSINELFDDRYQKIFPVVSATSHERARGEHQITVLRHNVPLVNFILVEGASETDLFFGWAVSDEFTTSPVFHSRDPSLVEMFHNYFMILQRKGITSGPIKVDYRQQGMARLQGCTIVDRIGIWITVAHKRTADLQDGISEHSISSIGVLAIDVKQGRIFINGQVHYPYEGVSGDLTAMNIVSTTNTLLYDYSNAVQTARKEGEAIYHFEKLNDGRELVRGFLVTEKHTEKLDLTGVRYASVDLSTVGSITLKDPSVVAAVQHVTDHLKASRKIKLLALPS